MFSPTFMPIIFMRALIKMTALMEKLVEQASRSNSFHHSGTACTFIIYMREKLSSSSVVFIHITQ